MTKLDDYRNRPRQPRRRKNDPLDSPLVRLTRVAVTKHLEKAIAEHNAATDPEKIAASGGYILGLGAAMQCLEFVAVEMARKATL